MSLENKIKTDCISHELIDIHEAIESAKRTGNEKRLMTYRVAKIKGEEYIHVCKGLAGQDSDDIKSCKNCNIYSSIEEE